MAVALLVALAVVAVAAIAGARVLTARVRDERARAVGLAASLAEARDEAAASAGAADAARSERDVALARVDAVDALVRSLWSLELLRVTREWAVTGAVVPGGDGASPTVAEDTGAELTMALRMELDRRREESGVPGELDPSMEAASGSIGAVPVASALGALRLLEELLATVARPSEGFTLAVRVDDRELVATITLDAADADVPVLLADVASDAGGSIEADGPTVTLRLPA